MKKQRIFLGITGASGMPYAWTLAAALADSAAVELHMCMSVAAQRVFALESDISQDELLAMAHASYAHDNIAAPPASGSWQMHGAVVCPCSMATLGTIASGCGTNLIHRTADVALKQRLPLLLVPRESPLSAIHMENMLRVHQAGASIIPPSPHFYLAPQSIQDIVNQTCGRILDMLGITHTLCPRWQ